jgi:hypothetical protein
VDFVSDEHFLKCVKYVCEGYGRKAQLERNGLDIFKAVFDITNHKTSYDDWTLSEQVRQSDKTVNNKIGEFHQMLLGGVDGWEDLHVGDETRVDLKNKSNTIFVELKNKHNTVTFGKLRDTFDVLKKIVDKYPKAIAYYAYIIPKVPGSGEKVWMTSQRQPHPRILEAWGKRIYEIVAGDSKALEKTWMALPKAIADVIGNGNSINSEDLAKLTRLFQSAF